MTIKNILKNLEGIHGKGKVALGGSKAAQVFVPHIETQDTDIYIWGNPQVSWDIYLNVLGSVVFEGHTILSMDSATANSSKYKSMPYITNVRHISTTFGDYDLVMMNPNKVSTHHDMLRCFAASVCEVLLTLNNDGTFRPRVTDGFLNSIANKSIRFTANDEYFVNKVNLVGLKLD